MLFQYQYIRTQTLAMIEAQNKRWILILINVWVTINYDTMTAYF